MVVIDVVVGLLIVSTAIFGAMVGAGRALPAAGFALGAVIGTRLPLLFGVELDGELALLIALPAALIAGALVGGLAESLAPRAAKLARDRIVLDLAGGAVFAGSAAAVVVWALAPAASEVASARDPIRRSEVLARFNAVLTPAGPIRMRQPPPINDIPRIAGRTPDVSPGDPRLLFDTDVLRAERSVVRITHADCDGGSQGSGWTAADGVVVTNAHVVEGAQTILVQAGGGGRRLPAVPIWFDARHDIALLRVAQLHARPLPLADDTRSGIPAVMLGFPGDRATLRRARLGPTMWEVDGRLRDAPRAADARRRKSVKLVRGVNGPGGSGGPVVDGRGQVLATVAAIHIFIRDVTIAVPNRYVDAALRAAGPPVRTGDCGELGGGASRRWPAVAARARARARRARRASPPGRRSAAQPRPRPTGGRDR